MKFLYLMKFMNLFKGRLVRSLQILICYLVMSLAAPLHAAENPDISGYVMHVQMTPAACSFDSSRQKQRKCLEGYSLTIASLLPEVPLNRDCSTKTSAKLSPLQAKVVARVMPDENARVQLWQNVGGCMSMNASQYFRTVINYAERLKVPAELTSPETRPMHIANLRLRFLRLNPTLPVNAIKFNCSVSHGTPILTEVKLCYKNNGQYKQCPATVESNCPVSFIIKGSY